MAVIIKISLKNCFTSGFQRVANAFINFIVSISTVKNRFLQVDPLKKTTDAEFAASVLNRKDAARHVF